jgi:hypothetical protein
MSIFSEYEVPSHPCPKCGCKLDRASNTTSDGMVEEDDFTVCIKCATVLRYNADLSLRISTNKEIPPYLRKQIRTIQKAIAITKRKFN